ncbi:MAG: HAD hydrolase-like protein [Bacillota bacterium]|nr:HAD hydrolase-like protein [Bacillota bacterium]
MRELFYNTILFDLDGTLTDSAAGITRSVSFALQKFGMQREPETLTSFIGPPLQLSFQKECGLSGPDARLAVEYYREYYRDRGIYENRLYPGVPEMLTKLNRNGAKLCLATSKPTVFAEKVLAHFNIARFFIHVAGSNLDGSRVEKREIIAHVLSMAGSAETARPVMVGDREHDIIGAHHCEIASIAVTYGYGSLEALTTACPDHIVSSVKTLESLLLIS